MQHAFSPGKMRTYIALKRYALYINCLIFPGIKIIEKYFMYLDLEMFLSFSSCMPKDIADWNQREVRTDFSFGDICTMILRICVSLHTVWSVA